MSSSAYPLTNYETLLLSYNKCGDSLVMGLAFVENTTEECELTASVCKQALAHLQKRHPFLRSYLDQATNSLIVQDDEYSELELDYANELISYSDLIRELESFNSKPFDFAYKSNLSRCKVASFVHLNNAKMFSISLSVCLIITDGINITTLVIELINIVNALLTNKECIEMSETLKPVESLNYMINKHSMIGAVQRDTFNELSKLKPADFLLPDAFRVHNESGFKLNLVRLDKDVTSQLLAKARQNKIRLSGYFNAVVLYALRDLYMEYDLEFAKELTCGNTVNMRMRYSPNMSFSEMRMQVCITDLLVREENLSGYKNIWKDAAFMHHKIQEASDIELGILFYGSHNEAYLRECIDAFNSGTDLRDKCIRLNKLNHSDLGLSNIGSYVWNKNMVAEGPVKIRESYFSDSLVTVPNALPGLIFHIAFWDGQIMIQLSSNKAAINSVFVDKLISFLEARINESV